jgi:flagellar biosynthesis GTPase FlhF
VLEEERKKRLAERKVQRKEERRAKWLKEREEEEERKREEEQKLLEEEARRKQEEEEQKKKIRKEIEAEEYRCVIVVWVLSVHHCMLLLHTNGTDRCCLYTTACYCCVPTALTPGVTCLICVQHLIIWELNSCQESQNISNTFIWFVCQAASASQLYFSQLDQAYVLSLPSSSSSSSPPSFSWHAVGPPNTRLLVIVTWS